MHYPKGQYGFYNALDSQYLEWGCKADLLTHRELLMVRIMNTITEKPNWEEKVFKEEITGKWRDEIAQSGEDVTPKMMDWIIKELQWTAKNLEKTGYIRVFDVGVIKSDTAIPEDVREALKQAVQPLENVPTDQKDFHPDSDDKVVDLVHPSLFPVIFGRTRVLKDRILGLQDCLSHMGEGDILPSEPCAEREIYEGDAFSKRFQWLPCEVKLLDDTCQIESYINNAHPVQHKDLYGVLEKIISRVIPLWNQSLSEITDSRIGHQKLKYGEHPDPEPQEPEGEDYDEDEFYETYQKWRNALPLIIPEPGEFKPRNVYEDLDLRKHFPKTNLQVIVKLANIELSPDNPTYKGGSWHIEGQLNERICASAIYYYDCKNITENQLAFRQRGMSDLMDLEYEQNQHEFLQAVYGFDDEIHGGSNNDITQDLGAVTCKQGRLITFPNAVQHRVSPFSLADLSKPGHRKILALFLVDPHRRIISTANVPPQREDWGREKANVVDQVLSNLPMELQNMVESDLHPLMTMEEAKEHRLELMKERGLKSEENNGNFERGDFSLCEH
ncbi:unnamed protein product [Penicillium salamii]|uniref:Uncharacterized protein n=1 Tax=Penicillium salamii TaxID=1612424 RepID=A0A9W4JMH6_9EURO|nr:unnamed protein product [Penicillium salamii]CAG8299174.1 unnamed protein product [Penicillium salamii]CAG8353198.1 unnamed protein product [Penicillium salamii]CAG8359460.1 unnamed protein product [Penicillium salamii]CAG8368040.1 unnamed protein product [Penicillium salamii]